jgi:uracil-DNA glycosylase
MPDDRQLAIEGHVRFLRELGIYDLYRRPVTEPIASPELATTSSMPEFTPENSSAPIEQTPCPAASGKLAQLTALQQEIGLCMRCPLATQGRHTVVFGDGDPQARLMFVGEGPGADEDAQGLPFVGRAGQLLNNMITAMGLKRSEVYIANIVKCRPPNNRAPEPIEANTCLQFLMRQYEIIQPEVVVALGATAATYLLGAKASLGSLRGRTHEFRQSKLIITYHPAYLLRDPRQKKETWLDLQIAMQLLGLTLPASNG